MVPHDGSSSSQAERLSVRGRTKERTPIMEAEAKVRTATGAGRNPETRNITDIARETGMTSHCVSSCRTWKRGKVTNKVTSLTFYFSFTPMVLFCFLKVTSTARIEIIFYSFLHRTSHPELANIYFRFRSA